MRLDQFLYMNEAEGTGWVDTRYSHMEAAAQDFIKMAKEGYDINSPIVQNTILTKHNLSDLSTIEANYIARRVGSIL